MLFLCGALTAVHSSHPITSIYPNIENQLPYFCHSNIIPPPPPPEVTQQTTLHEPYWSCLRPPTVSAKPLPGTPAAPPPRQGLRGPRRCTRSQLRRKKRQRRHSHPPVACWHSPSTKYAIERRRNSTRLHKHKHSSSTWAEGEHTVSIAGGNTRSRRTGEGWGG